MAAWIQDFRFGARILGRNPGFSAMAVVVLAVGIGANSAMFSGTQIGLCPDLVLTLSEPIREAA
jgi:hypothetical protein